ncbi:GyrI-like domain-containing protein [Flavobacterium orientale]|uniref:GyrI-like small molecule binding domain-containing protein n=1 Tax=Flavobacterium orientale TaxID=1756020 RepID=A0A917DGF7_9FLAO|nr:GyrI-like domain-containing protein [Flavobacterium orientale]GGD35015.1 hypothetical protein GCM10011343_26090 [Flavobacterium orientale]
MRIIKYILMLLVLLFAAAAIFVYTQNGAFEVEKSKTIAFQKNVIFNYVNDYSNWPSFLVLYAEDAKAPTKQSDITYGEASFATWDAISFATEKTTAYDSITQNLNWNGAKISSQWHFSTAQKNTKVSWKIKGNLGFKERFLKLIGLGSFRTIARDMSKTLDQLDKVLLAELNHFEITVNGIVEVPEMAFLQQMKSVAKADFYANMPSYLSKSATFFEEFELEMSGNPLCFFESTPTDKKEMQVKMCYPINEEIFTSPESEITYGKSERFQAVKATFTGDYLHIEKAWAALLAYCKTNNIDLANPSQHLEIYVQNYLQSNKPSHWVTELYLPIRTSNPIPPPPVITEQLD